MKPKRSFKIVKQPIYPGGRKAMKDFILNNLIYPSSAIQNNIEGVVFLKYEINHKGIVNKSKVVHSLGFGCDEEAKRLVKLLKFKVPKSRNIKALFHKSIKITFKINKENNSMEIKYNFQASPKSKPSYNYNIKI